MIEERAKGDPSAADGIRSELRGAIGVDLGAVVPGSPEAARLKDMLVERGMWSQYLEVGIGPDAEVFTKAQPMSAVGTGAEIGIHSASSWNNPEPEIVLVVNARGETVGATLGNDVNLRDVEGRSALLLGKAKDNNASAAIGPFIRLFDDDYGIDDVRSAELALRGQRSGWVRARRRKLDVADQPRSAGAGGRDHRGAPPVPGRGLPDDRHAVLADERPGCGGGRVYPQGG